MRTRIALLSLGLCLLLPTASRAQDYHNLKNTRFATVASGPMQALVVDVDDPTDTAAARQAVLKRVAQSRQARVRGAEAYLKWLRRAYPEARRITLGIPEVVMLRQPGRSVVLPAAKQGRGANEITLAFPATGQPGAWVTALQQDIQNTFDVLYSEMKTIYGAPSWSGTLTVLNGDNLYPSSNLSDPNVFWGGVFNASTHELYLAAYSHQQTLVLNMAQSLLLAFRGSSSISYDAWERGMARAAGQVVVRNSLTQLASVASAAYGGTLGDLDLSDPFFHGLDRYDLLNQAPLGNDRFFPLAKENGENGTSDFPLMMYNRLQMAGSAWMKIATIDPLFFKSFNEAYYQALASNSDLKNDVPALKTLAKQVFDTDTGSTIAAEGLDFVDWYARQYALDTAVTPGAKLYSDFVFSRADTSSSTDADLYSVALVMYYYETTWNGTQSDETGLNAASYPIYWDYTYTARFNLGAQYERVQFGEGGIDGIGTVTPGFPDTLGGDATLYSRMRVAVDMPVRAEYARFYVAPRSAGTLQNPNNFWGVVVGANSGTVKIEADGISSGDVAVAQGAFGAAVDTSLFSRPRRATITFTSQDGSTTTTRQVVTGYNQYVGVIYASDPIETVSHTFTEPLAMVTFPVKPLKGKAAEALVDSNGVPIFAEGDLLLAQWRQNLTGDDRYLKYPAIEALTPGKAYWFQHASGLTANIVGMRSNNQIAVSTGLIVGWNQIGNPYETAISVSDLVFQYREDTAAVDLATAVTKGWVAAATVGSDQVILYQWDSANGYTRATALAPWKGYFIKVLVSEGLTITYPNPTLTSLSRAAATRASKASTSSSGWGLPLRVNGPDNTGSTCYIGQSVNATAGYDAEADAAMPPAFTRSAPTIGFSHSDWGSNSGTYFTDVRKTGARTAWEVTVTTPEEGKTYTVTWPQISRVPRTVRLTIKDLSTGRSQAMTGASGVSFVSTQTGSRRFQISAEPRVMSALRITGVVARDSRAAGSRSVSIGYNVSADATVQLRIRGADGRVLRTISQGRAVSSGANTALWDTRTDAGVSVPAGMYLVDISAQSGEGDVAHFSHPVTLIR